MFEGETIGFGGLEKDLKEAGENINNIMSNFKDFRTTPDEYYNSLAMSYNRIVVIDKALKTMNKELFKQYSSFVIHSFNATQEPFKNPSAMHHYENELFNLVVQYGFRSQSPIYKTLVANAHGAYIAFSEGMYSKNKAYLKEFSERVNKIDL